MNLYEIRERLLSSGKAVFNMAQLSNILGIPRNHAKVYASRLVERGWAWRPMRGVIALTRDEFIVATQLIEPSYISMHSALYLLGLVDQVPSRIECVTTRYSIEVSGIRYRRVVPRLFFGYRRVDRAGSYVFVALPEKALLDMIYFGYSPPGWMLSEVSVPTLGGMARRYSGLRGYRAKRVVRWVRSIAHQRGNLKIGEG
ncbi:MAG: hypothetical protein J7J65_05090 [Candidatus Korarchaeota archaeon]|nr:hypothetical protein [Candidatus Korarchaeota archaeon]